MVMRFFGGGVGHLQSLQVVHQHLEAADPESEPIASESESESDMEVPLGKDDGNDPMDSDDEVVEDTSDKGIEDSDSSSLGSGCVSDSEPEDGYDSL